MKLEQIHNKSTYQPPKKEWVLVGQPIFTPDFIPIHDTGESFINRILSVEGEELAVTCLGVGKPYAVLFQSDLSQLDIEHQATSLLTHSIFLSPTVVAFVKIVDQTILAARLWDPELGEVTESGEGACAVLAAAAANDYVGHQARVLLPGKAVDAAWDEQDDCLYWTE